MNEFMSQLLQNSLLTSAAVLLLLLLSQLLRKKTSPRLRVICWIVVAAAFLFPARPVLFTIPTRDLAPVINELTTQQDDKASLPEQEITAVITQTDDEMLQSPLNESTPKEEAHTELPLGDNSVASNINDESGSAGESVSGSESTGWFKLLPWQTIIFYVWILGFIISLTIITTGHIRLTRRIMKRSSNVTNAAMISLLNEVCRITGVNKYIHLKINPLVKSPVTLGLFHPVILLPEGASNDNELRFMLMHEVMHIRRGDLWSKALSLVVMVVHWFNPAVYFMNRAIDAEMEMACDAAVLSYTGDEQRKKYGETVFLVAKRSWQPMPKLTSAFSGSGKNLKHRLSAIIERKNTRRWVTICCAAVMVLSLTIAGLAGCSQNTGGEFIDAPVDLTPTDKLLIYIPADEYFNVQFKTAIDIYRAKNRDVEVTVERFGHSFYPEEEYQTRVTTELMAGKGPDIVLTNYNYFEDIQKTIETGVFLNLNEVLEQDEEFNLDDYYKVVMDAGIYKGGRYIIPLSFSSPITLSERGMLDKIGFDLSANTDFVSFIDHAVSAMPKVREINPTGRITWLWGRLLDYSGISLVDFENNTILPDEEKFRAMCEAYKPYYDYEISAGYDWKSPLDLFTEGISYFSIDTFSAGELFTYGRLSLAGYDPVLSYIRSADGGLNVTVRQSVAIRAGSKNHYNAWQFIKLLLSEEMQYGTPGTMEDIAFHGILVNKAAQERKVNAHKRMLTVGMNDGTFTLPNTPEETLQQVKDYLNSITSCSLDNTTLFSEFFAPIMTPYFKGEVTYDEAVDELKHKLRFYLSE